VPPPPGRLHQTRAPTERATRAAFRAEMADLWTAVVTGRPARRECRPFFPLTAYRQVKAIYDPAADWNSRLVGDFRLDVAAARRLLGHGAAHARLVAGSSCPRAQAGVDRPWRVRERGWLLACSAGRGWFTGGAGGPALDRDRLPHLVAGAGGMSCISARLLRGGAYGVVDQPSAGTGVPGPAGGLLTC